jgi:hypothetical protein
VIEDAAGAEIGAQRLFEMGEGVEQSAQRHVPRNAAEGIQVTVMRHGM